MTSDVENKENSTDIKIDQIIKGFYRKDVRRFEIASLATANSSSYNAFSSESFACKKNSLIHVKSFDYNFEISNIIWEGLPLYLFLRRENLHRLSEDYILKFNKITPQIKLMKNYNLNKCQKIFYPWGHVFVSSGHFFQLQFVSSDEFIFFSVLRLDSGQSAFQFVDSSQKLFLLKLQSLFGQCGSQEILFKLAQVRFLFGQSTFQAQFAALQVGTFLEEYNDKLIKVNYR